MLIVLMLMVVKQQMILENDIYTCWNVWNVMELVILGLFVSVGNALDALMVIVDQKLRSTECKIKIILSD